MNIILVSNNMAKAKTLSVLQVSLIVLALIVLPVLIALMVIVPQEPNAQQGAKSLIPSQLRFAFNHPQKRLDAYAVQMGEIQARMMRLDAQTERLAKLAGEKNASHNTHTDTAKSPKLVISPQLKERSTSNPPVKGNQGGPLVLKAPMSEALLQKHIAELIGQIEVKTEQLDDIEAKLLQQSVLKDMLPNNSPVSVAYNSSSYGWRVDPFNGSSAFHEGLDFTASVGTPIYAAADGIVSAAEQVHDYGKIVKVDHGQGLETRYAHASRLLVHAGERVVKGQKIAEVGSTGRSTGPHLHYEIRLNGNSLDPRKYLKASN